MAAFGLLFIMEMGDKTQLAVLSLSANTGRAGPVFLGASLALSLVTALGVALGAGAGKLVPSDWLSRAAALAFIAIGAFMLWRARRWAPENRPSSSPRLEGLRGGIFGVIGASFALLFFAEMGDKTQLAVVSLTAKTGSPVSVLAGALLALVLLTLLGAMVGKLLMRLIPIRWVSSIAGLIFVVSGVLSLLGLF